MPSKVASPQHDNLQLQTIKKFLHSRAQKKKITKPKTGWWESNDMLEDIKNDYVQFAPKVIVGN